MLTKFSVTNFKGFKEKITLDLTAENYNFNENCIKNGYVNKAIIYGKNGSGKTNLSLAIFDIISNLTDKISMPINSQDTFYENLEESLEKTINFNYEFILNGKKIEYSYKKLYKYTFVYEKLVINDKTIIEHNRNDNKIKLNWNSLENSGFDNSLQHNGLSTLKYIYKNSKVKDFEDDISKSFIDLIEFVEHMLMFYSLHGRGFIGYETNGSQNIFTEILTKNKLKDFQKFLSSCDIHYDLVETQDEYNKPSIAIKFGDTKVLFHKICSSGTFSLALFYFWYMNIDNLKLLVIDEFDAFYHHKLSKEIIRKLINNNCQVILTTHNTSIMSNDLMRPDCYFNIKPTNISSFSKKTDKELRQAHNIEKMYKSGKFDE